MSVWGPVPVTVPVAAGDLHLINWSRLGSELGGGLNCLINDRMLTWRREPVSVTEPGAARGSRFNYLE